MSDTLGRWICGMRKDIQWKATVGYPPSQEKQRYPLTGSIVVPVWRVGDEWQYAYKSPSDSGTYVWVVKRVEALDGVNHYVVKGGTREIFYRVSDLWLAVLSV